MELQNKRTNGRQAETFRMVGFDRHRIGVDGAGVTTLVVFHGCPLNCRYCLNPQTLSAKSKYRSLTPEALYQAVKPDDLYFRATGGGVTFCGGEPLLSYKPILHFHKLCMDDGKRWCFNIETSLNVPASYVCAIEQIIDHWIVDIKDMNPGTYRAYTGKDNAQVVQNLQHLIGQKAKVTVRVPLIPAFNTEADVENSIAILHEMGVRDIDRLTYIIKYH